MIDYTLFFPYELLPNQVGYVQVNTTEHNTSKIEMESFESDFNIVFDTMDKDSQ